MDSPRAAALDQAAAPAPCLIGRSHHLADLYNLVNVPQAVWIDGEGRIVRPPETAGSMDAFRAMDRKTFTIPNEVTDGATASRRSTSTPFAIGAAWLRERAHDERTTCWEKLNCPLRRLPKPTHASTAGGICCARTGSRAQVQIAGPVGCIRFMGDVAASGGEGCTRAGVWRSFGNGWMRWEPVLHPPAELRYDVVARDY
jgi:hypothetical protein